MDAPQSPDVTELPLVDWEGGQISQSDRSLVVMVRDGDADAAEMLYDRYARRLLALVERQMGNRLRARVDPEDIVQSVFKSMFRGVQAGNYDAPEGSTLWNLIAVIAVNKLRRHGSRIARQSANVPLESVDESVCLDQQSMECFEASVRETLELLRSFDRTILSMRLELRTVEEISSLTGWSRRSVERSLQNSRQRLADALLEDA